MKRSNLNKANAAELVVDVALNFRKDYDLPSMEEEILQMGRIVEPVHVLKDTKKVLKGNRRIGAAQNLLKRKDLPDTVRKALEAVEVFYYEGMTEREVTEFMLDHGSQKPLSRVETVLAVWRLQRQMYTERDIITILYNQLARYTGNTRKAYEASTLNAGEAREKFLVTWLHGTVGNYLLAAGQMGELVKAQLILTETSIDRALTEAEKKEVKFTVSRDRVNKLATAKKKDKEAKGWSPENGGELFNAQIDAFIKEDVDGGPPRKEKLDVERIEQTADSMNSGMRLAFLQCAGKLPENEKVKLDALDTEYYRRDKIFAVLNAECERISDANVKQLVRAILMGAEKDVKETLVPFVPATV